MRALLTATQIANALGVAIVGGSFSATSNLGAGSVHLRRRSRPVARRPTGVAAVTMRKPRSRPAAGTAARVLAALDSVLPSHGIASVLTPPSGAEDLVCNLVQHVA